uniref:CCHC-type domain-containing protein n=1 Tax=Oryza meridionalis TaxID=40149 RepID=A0A0E0ELK1_9ORYZ
MVSLTLTPRLVCSCCLVSGADLIEATAAATTVKPLNGAEEYLRWKESMLLVLHTAGVAHVLSDEPPQPPPAAAAAGVKEEDGEAEAEAAAAAGRRRWARDDAVCRGHILAALHDRIFPDYVRHGTARAAWEAVARAYDGAGALSAGVARRAFDDLEFYADAPLPEQIAHAEALNAATRLPLGDEDLAGALCEMLPENVGGPASALRRRRHHARRLARRPARGDAPRLQGRHGAPWHYGRFWRCGKPGHHTSNCMG